MDYDKIILDLLNRIVILEERVSKLENENVSATPQTPDLPAGSKKYRFLSDFLYESSQPSIKLSYEEIEEILGFSLPNSAIAHRAFWANTNTHSIALSWLSVGYEVVEINLEEKYIIFEKKRSYDVMTIPEQMKQFVNELISERGLHCKISRNEIRELVHIRFQRNIDSVIPSDFCYDRANKGVDFYKTPRLFAYLGNGMYECLGENFPFNGSVYAKGKNEKYEVEVGEWKNGIFTKNENWAMCGLK